MEQRYPVYGKYEEGVFHKGSAHQQGDAMQCRCHATLKHVGTPNTYRLCEEEASMDRGINRLKLLLPIILFFGRCLISDLRYFDRSDVHAVAAWKHGSILGYEFSSVISHQS